jgi:predicted transcriptional regulator
MFGNAFASPFIVPVVAIICWAVISVAKIKNGSDRGWHKNPRNTHVPPMFEKMLEKAMEERDAEIQVLRERVEVLEKIVTDTHVSVSLATEIDNLRNAQ